MSVEELVLDKLRNMPAEKQQQVLEFVNTLVESNDSKPPRQNWMGKFDHLNLNISAEDIDEARREMWGNFPRSASHTIW